MNRRRLYQAMETGDVIAAADIAALHLCTVTAGVAAYVTAKQVAGPAKKCILTLAACPLVVTDALAYAGTQLLTFPEGRIFVKGVVASIQWAVTTDRTAVTGTINDSASLNWGLGTVTASNVTLSTTMQDLIPSTVKVLSAATTALNTASNAVLAAAATTGFDGTTTAIKAFLNGGFITTTDIDNDGTLTATGTITISYEWLGDF